MTRLDVAATLAGDPLRGGLYGGGGREGETSSDAASDGGTVGKVPEPDTPADIGCVVPDGEEVDRDSCVGVRRLRIPGASDTGWMR